MTAPSTPEGRIALGNEGRAWRISYTEFLAASGTPEITFTSGDDTPDATTYTSAVEIGKFATDNFKWKFGTSNFEKQTHSRGKLKFSGQEMMELEFPVYDWLDPNFLAFMPGVVVNESSSRILLKAAPKRGVTSDVILLVFPQSTNQLYMVMYEPEGEGLIEGEANADGTSLVSVTLKLTGRKKTSRAKGDRVGIIAKVW